MDRSVLKRIALILTTALLITGTADAQEVPKPWRIAVTRFSGSGLSLEQSQHLSGIPLSIIRTVERTPVHNPSETERRKRWEEDQDRELRELELQLNKKIRTRDLLYLQREGTSVLRAASEDIDEIRNRIDVLMSEEYSWEKAADRIDILLAEKNRNGELYDFPELPLDIWCYRAGFDAVISGFIERLGELLYIEIKAYSAASGQTETLYRGSFFSNERDVVLEESRPSIRTYTYGREWSDLIVEVEPENAEYLIDGVPAIPDGRGRFSYLAPGSREVIVSAEGYESKSFSIDLQSNESGTLNASLNSLNPVSLLIRSEPDGADVFIDSRLSGATPLYVEELVPPATILLRRDGFQEQFRVMDGGTPLLDFKLHPDSVDINGIVEKSRSRFYRGLTAFLLSLPLTVVTYGQSEQFAYAYNSAVTTGTGSIDEIDRLKTQSTLWYTAYLGSLFLNSILFADTIIGMTHYIRSSQEY